LFFVIGSPARIRT